MGTSRFAMITRSLALCTAIMILWCASARTQDSETLDSLYSNKHYFELREAVANASDTLDSDLLFYRGAVFNKFYKPDSAIVWLERFVALDPTPDSALAAQALKLLGDSYLETHEFANMEKVFQRLVDDYSHFLDSSQILDDRNLQLAGRALRDYPAQKVTISDSFSLELERGEMPINVNGYATTLGLDTGANLSAIMSSLADSMGIKTIPAGLQVETVSGDWVLADLGVADSFVLGKAVFEHVVFLVLPDSALYIEQAHFQIRGVLGFPILAGLQQITYEKNSSIHVPKSPAACDQVNLCVDQLSLLIRGTYRGKQLAFQLDTGAGRSFFYPPFYDAFRDHIDRLCNQGSESVLGPGGSREVPACMIDTLLVKIAGEDVLFANAPVFKEYTLEDSRYLAGNIGRDALANFAGVTLNLKAMCITFE